MHKHRKPFQLKDADGSVIGHGVAYRDGNVQVYLKAHDNAAWQMQLADVLTLEGVYSFEWVAAEKRVDTHNGYADAGNWVWNRIDGAYDPKEFN